MRRYNKELPFFANSGRDTPTGYPANWLAYEARSRSSYSNVGGVGKLLLRLRISLRSVGLTSSGEPIGSDIGDSSGIGMSTGAGNPTGVGASADAAASSAAAAGTFGEALWPETPCNFCICPVLGPVGLGGRLPKGIENSSVFDGSPASVSSCSSSRAHGDECFLFALQGRGASRLKD